MKKELIIAVCSLTMMAALTACGPAVTGKNRSIVGADHGTGKSENVSVCYPQSYGKFP